MVFLQRGYYLNLHGGKEKVGHQSGQAPSNPLRDLNKEQKVGKGEFADIFILFCPQTPMSLLLGLPEQTELTTSSPGCLLADGRLWAFSASIM